MPTPRPPSLYDVRRRTALFQDPLSRWLQLARSEREFIEVLVSTDGLPPGWIAWAERDAARFDASIDDKSILSLRVRSLWNGITSLQEGKFLCDLIENGLRSSAAEWATQHSAPVDAILATIPIQHERESACQYADFEDLLTSLSFYQLTEMFARNWSHAVRGKPIAPGFSTLFAHDRPCHRDVNLFRQQMKSIRGIRNDIAHSRRLLSESEVVALYRTVARWLAALGVDAAKKVQGYRKGRPRFLAAVDGASASNHLGHRGNR